MAYIVYKDVDNKTKILILQGGGKKKKLAII